jgi:type III secretion protein F
MTSVNTKATNMQSKIEKAIENPEAMDQMALLDLQFQLGQYNALTELTSSIGKGFTDMLKTLAQRTS